jgi:hypothetical protein
VLSQDVSSDYQTIVAEQDFSLDRAMLFNCENRDELEKLFRQLSPHSEHQARLSVNHLCTRPNGWTSRSS